MLNKALIDLKCISNRYRWLEASILKEYWINQTNQIKEWIQQANPVEPNPIKTNNFNKANHAIQDQSNPSQSNEPNWSNPVSPIDQSKPIISNRVESKSNHINQVKQTNPINPIQCQASSRSNQPNHINHPNQSIHSTPCQISVFIRQSDYIILQRRNKSNSKTNNQSM